MQGGGIQKPVAHKLTKGNREPHKPQNAHSNLRLFNNQYPAVVLRSSLRSDLAIVHSSTMDDEKRSHAEDGAPRPTSKDSESPAIETEPIDKETQPPSPKTHDQGPAVTETEPSKEEWITGLKLAVIVAAITMAAFLILLDVSIVATVSPSSLIFVLSC
jgi:hypothetical protein